jgi:glycosyltransferase involved in cell wall biosynthesis
MISESRLISSITAVMLSYNEAPMLEITLPRLKECVDQIIILDMESDDGSHLLYRDLLSADDRVVNYRRRNLFDYGFAHPRNYAACFAKSPWLFAIDADELIIPEEMRSFKRMQVRDTRKFHIARHNYVRAEGFGLDDIPKILNEGQFSKETHCRITPNLPEIQWQGTIHEELRDGLDDKSPTSPSGITLHHLNAFKAAPEREKQGLYYYLTLKAVAFPRFRYGTNEYWFNEFTRTYLDYMFEFADEFCDKNNLDRISRPLVEERLG